MTKQICKFTFQATIILLFGVAVLGQSKSKTSSETVQDSISNLYEFSLAASKDKFQPGEDIDITLTLKNNDGQPIVFTIDRYNEFESYKIVLQTENGKDIVPKTDGRSMIGSRMGIVISPQEKFEQTLKLTKFYKPGIGKYKLVVLTNIVTEYSLDKIGLTTNQIEFEITEN